MAQSIALGFDTTELAGVSTKIRNKEETGKSPIKVRKKIKNLPPLYSLWKIRFMLTLRNYSSFEGFSIASQGNEQKMNYFFITGHDANKCFLKVKTYSAQKMFELSILEETISASLTSDSIDTTLLGRIKRRIGIFATFEEVV